MSAGPLDDLYFLLERQSREVFDLAHARPVPQSLASMLCNMTERHSREVAAELMRAAMPDAVHGVYLTGRDVSEMWEALRSLAYLAPEGSLSMKVLCDKLERKG